MQHKTYLLRYLLIILIIGVGTISFSANNDTVFYEFWDINSLTNIGGHNVKVYGAPVIVDTEKGKAVFFDGVDDALIVDNNPIGEAKEFTFEVLFKPNSGQPNISNEPRFVCFWNPENPDGPRMTIEIRVKSSKKWYFDAFLKTNKEKLALIDPEKTHPTDQWVHAAVTYKNSIFTTYINGRQELSDTVSYTSNLFDPTGKTSVGARYNLTGWFNGSIKAIKVTHAALSPANFFSIPDIQISSGVKVH